MDYGYQLLRHVVQQVFGNLGAAARLTIVPIVLAYVVCGLILYALLGPLLFDMFDQQAALGGMPEDPFGSEAAAAAFAGRFLLGFLICLPVFLTFYAWAAVGWHRFVLLEEYPSGFSSKWNWPTIRGYVWAIVRLALFVTLLGLVAVVAIGVLISIAPSPGFALFLTLGMSILFTWVVTRLGLILPSAALGTYMKIGESWSATGPISGAILLPIIVIPLTFFLINSLLGLVGVLGAFLTIVVIWLQTLVNLALMTTLYGNLIEGRQLN